MRNRLLYDSNRSRFDLLAERDVSVSPTNPSPTLSLSIRPHDRRSFLTFALIVEGTLFLLAFVLGILVEIDPLLWLHWNWGGMVKGTLAAVPLIAFFFLAERFRPRPLEELRCILVDHFGPFLARLSNWDLIYLACLAGICEEVLFRGMLQPWLSQSNWWFGLIATSVIFGLLHFVTATYAIVAALAGLYLGWLLEGLGEQNLLIPIVAHTVYDAVAFFAVRAFYRREHPEPKKKNT